MNQQSITTPEKTVLLKYTPPYIIYNLICFYKYIIFIYSILPYYINFEFTSFASSVYHLLLYSNTTTLIMYYSYFQIKIYLHYFESHGEHVTNLNNDCAHPFSWILFLELMLNIGI